MRLFKAFTMLIGLLVFAGCVHQQGVRFDRSDVSLLGGARYHIQLLRSTMKQDQTGAYEVIVALQNKTPQPVVLECRSHFWAYDATESEKPSAWKRLFVPGEGIATYKEYSTLNSGISNYHVEVREAGQ